MPKNNTSNMLLSTMNKLSTPHTTVKVFEIGILNPVLGFCQGLPLPRDHQFIKKAPVYRSINEDFGLLYSHSKVFSLHSLPSLQAASKMLTLCYPSSASHFPTHPSQHHPKVVALKSKGPAGLSSRSTTVSGHFQVKGCGGSSSHGLSHLELHGTFCISCVLGWVH